MGPGRLRDAGQTLRAAPRVRPLQPARGHRLVERPNHGLGGSPKPQGAAPNEVAPCCKFCSSGSTLLSYPQQEERAMANAVVSVDPAAARILVFVDYWNLQLSIQERHGGTYSFDWTKLPGWLCQRAADVATLKNSSYLRTRHYASYDPAGNGKLKGWMTSFLDRQPGVQVTLKARRRKKHPKCPSCHQPVTECPKCSAPFTRTEERGSIRRSPRTW